MRRAKPLTAASLLLELQAVDEHGLQLADVVGGLYGDAHPAGRARKLPRRVTVRLANVFIVGVPGASRGALKRLVHVPVQLLGRESAVVLDLVQSGNDVEVVFRPGAVTGAVARAVGGAVRHQAGVQAAVSSHHSVQVQSSDERFSDVDGFGPVDWVVVTHAGKGALEAYGENQLLLTQQMLKKRNLPCLIFSIVCQYHKLSPAQFIIFKSPPPRSREQMEYST